MEFTIDYIKENLDFWVNENLLSPSEFEFSKILEANLQDENVDFFYKIFHFFLQKHFIFAYCTKIFNV